MKGLQFLGENTEVRARRSQVQWATDEADDRHQEQHHCEGHAEKWHPHGEERPRTHAEKWAAKPAMSDGEAKAAGVVLRVSGSTGKEADNIFYRHRLGDSRDDRAHDSNKT